MNGCYQALRKPGDNDHLCESGVLEQGNISNTQDSGPVGLGTRVEDHWARLRRTVDGDVAAGVGLDVLHHIHLLAEGPSGGLEGYKLVILPRKPAQVSLEVLERQQDTPSEQWSFHTP